MKVLVQFVSALLVVVVMGAPVAYQYSDRIYAAIPSVERPSVPGPVIESVALPAEKPAPMYRSAVYHETAPAAKPAARPMPKPVLVYRSANFNRDLRALARMIHGEAGNQDYQGQCAVAQVAINRSWDPAFPPSIHDVVWMRRIRGNGSLGWEFDGISTPLPRRKEAYFMKVAYQAMVGKCPVPPAIADADAFYNPDYSAPGGAMWHKTRTTRLARLGDHVFGKIKPKIKMGWGARVKKRHHHRHHRRLKRPTVEVAISQPRT